MIFAFSHAAEGKMRLLISLGRFWPAVAALLVFALVAASCGDDDGATPTVTAAATGPATATTAAAYPVKVTDMTGREVEIKTKPAKIVAISPTAVEMVYAAGGTVIGRSSTVSYPAAAASAADVGSAYTPSAEKILALKPDLIVGDASIVQGKPDIKTTLDSVGVPVVYVGATNYADVLKGLDVMGRVLDATAKTDQAKASIEKAKDDAKAALASKKVTAIAITADEKQLLYAARDDSYVGDILKQLGITNAGASLPANAPFPGYSLLAPEKLLDLNPDYVFAITPDPRAPQLSATIAQIPAFAGLKAVTGKHVVDANVELFLQAPGPRIVDAFKAIQQALGGS